MRKKIIAGNWKMNHGPVEAEKFAKELKNYDLDDEVISIIFPPAINLPILKDKLTISLGAQNMYFEDSGAFTGEISGDMILEAGGEYVIIGHSERRQVFGETDEIINKKVKKAVEIGLKPILCCGENLEEREEEKHQERIESQIRSGLKGLSKEDLENLVIAYEPIWAIGTGKTASSEDAEEMCAFIRELVGKLYDEDTAEKLLIQYGGSVNPENIKKILAKDNIDGALVGGASLKAESFQELVNFKMN